MGKGLSKARSCAVVGLSVACTKEPGDRQADAELKKRLLELAHRYPRYGYRRLTDLLRQEGLVVNPKRIYRLYRLLGLQMALKPRPSFRQPARPLQKASRPNETWSMDFVWDQTLGQKTIKCLTVIDDSTRECITIGVARSLSSQDVIVLLEQAIAQRGAKPQALRTDNGPEFVSKAMSAWMKRQRIEHWRIQPGKPMQNGYIESFNGKFRDECLNCEIFTHLKEAQIKIEQYRQLYNNVRPHSSCQRMPPALYAQTLTQT